jgi:hypothetical protein
MAFRHTGSAFVTTLLAFVACATFADAPQPKSPGKICLNDSGNCETGSPVNGVKWHPGNYLLTWNDSPQRQMEAIRDEPYVIGAVRRYYWAQLEPQRGVYDFSAIEADLKYLKSMPEPKRLVIQIHDRTYRAKTPVGVIPNYILEDPRYGGKDGWYTANGSNWYGVAPANNGYASGYIARVWDPAVMDRLIALFQAVGARFDNERYLEAVSGTETTPGMKRIPPDYSKEQLAVQLKRWISEVVPAYPHTTVLMYANALGAGQLPGLIDHCYRNRCAVGGLDTMPTRDYSPTSSGPSEGQRIIMGDEGGTSYVGKMPVMFMVSNASLTERKGPNTPDSIYRYAVERLGATHLFWVQLENKYDTGSKQYSWDRGILPVIRANKGKTNTACPSNLKSCDTR